MSQDSVIHAAEKLVEYADACEKTVDCPETPLCNFLRNGNLATLLTSSAI